MLCSFALKAAQDRRNQLSVGLGENTPGMELSDVASKSLRIANLHAFGCPCSILDTIFQFDPKVVPNWEPCARVGNYPGRSPAQTSNGALVLNDRSCVPAVPCSL